MENQIVLPEIVPLFFKGERVWTTQQLSELFKVGDSAIKHAYERHKSILEKGLDFYDLRGKGLNDFKKETLANVETTAFSEKIAKCTVIKIWTESGALKLSSFIHTERARIIWATSFAVGAVELSGNRASVYAFKMSNGTVKIGMSNSVASRAKAVERATHLKVTKIFYRTFESRQKAFAIEKTLHKYFSAQCTQGEFFMIDFEEACEQIENLMSVPEIAQLPAPIEDSNILEKARLLIKAAELTENKNLREEMIHTAFKLLKN